MIGYSKKSQLGNEKEPQVKKNLSANQKLDLIYKEKGLYENCEVRVSESCLKVAKTSLVGTKLKMTYAHRHKRIWYKSEGREHLLYSFTETLRSCLPCHLKIENDRKLTNALFINLRGIKGK